MPSPDRRNLPHQVRQSASASTGARVVQAGGDLQYTEVHHHLPANDAIVVVERVLPRAEAVAEVFVGRESEVGSVLGILDPAHEASGMVVVSAVAGLAGIGKTALVRVCAMEAVSRGWFPGGALFVDLNGYAPQPDQRILPRQAYGPLLHTLGRDGTVHTAPAQQHALEYHRLLEDLAARERAVLLVLDNASTTDQIADLLPRSRRHRVVVTSRHTLAVRGSRTLDLGTLARADAVALIRRQFEQLSAWDGRVRDDEAGTLRLCELCENLPLALHIVTALLARSPSLTPDELADDLAHARSRLDLLDDGERAVRAAFELSYQRLSPEQARLFRILPVNPGPHFGIATAAQLLGKDPRSSRPLLHELSRAHMIEHVGAGAWRQHDLIRDYAIELSTACLDDQKAPAARLLDHYSIKAAGTGEVLRTARRDAPADSEAVQSALAWFDQEQPNLQAAVAMGVTFDDADAALRILEALVQLHRFRDQTAELVDTSQKIAALTTPGDERDDTVWALAGLSWTLGAFINGGAEAERLLDFDREQFLSSLADDPRAARTQLNTLFDTARKSCSRLSDEGRHAAVPLFHQIYHLASMTGLDTRLESEALTAASRLAHRLGDDRLQVICHVLEARRKIAPRSIGACLTALEEALELLTRSADTHAPPWQDACRQLTATALGVADALLTPRKGFRYDSGHAERAFHICRTTWRYMDAPGSEATALRRFAALRHHAGFPAEAISHYLDAVRIYEGLNRQKDVGGALLDLSAVHTAAGDPENAVQTAERAAAVFEAEQDLPSTRQALDVLALALLALGRSDEAIAASTKSEQMAVTTGDLGDRTSAAAALAQVLQRSGRGKEARRTARRALKLAKAADEPEIYYSLHNWLADNGLLPD
ncbi:tetratricopeptide (TPR) repeat protein [Streptomyces aurantiacus]|uniref:tetratricopeptide repeat protein n=1 Tax=Streptomyces aurantiacus TaxID=47760 RepID=UPI00278EB72F|nr:tetratricopeptide repeat protein [Streptomyces aurantiacus]MDQ0771814.1 tetratricopeptide (TPR) repeat protein [Streptomyces aurantiacus]